MRDMTKRLPFLPFLAFITALVFTAVCYASPPALVGGRNTRPEFCLSPN